MIKYLIAVAALAVAGSAIADGPVSATLQAPIAKATEAVAGGAVFACKADTCVAESDTSQLDELGMCRDIVRQLGAVSKFGSLSAAGVTKCNGSARH